ncbi:MAG: hypothetical protein K9L56_14455 [Clostridiales bacterium]|nr:hypothetical protein [Clostridiales bacterium]
MNSRIIKLQILGLIAIIAVIFSTIIFFGSFEESKNDYKDTFGIPIKCSEEKLEEKNIEVVASIGNLKVLDNVPYPDPHFHSYTILTDNDGTIENVLAMTKPTHVNNINPQMFREQLVSICDIFEEKWGDPDKFTQVKIQSDEFFYYVKENAWEAKWLKPDDAGLEVVSVKTDWSEKNRSLSIGVIFD